MEKIKKVLIVAFIGIIALVIFLLSNPAHSLSEKSRKIYLLRVQLDSTEVKNRQLELQKLQSVKAVRGLVENIIELMEHGNIKSWYHLSTFIHIVGKDLMGTQYESGYNKANIEKAKQEALDRLATYLYPYFLWRIKENRCNSLEQYRSFLAEDSREQEIINNMLSEFIEEWGMDTIRYDDFYMSSPLASPNYRSWFFRDTDYVDALLEKLLVQKISLNDKTIAAKSIGCAQGQEPYSLAMIIYEKLEKLGQHPSEWKVTIESYDKTIIAENLR